jgi:hypothetical protein
MVRAAGYIRTGKMTQQPLENLYKISLGIHARLGDRTAARPAGISAEAIETHWLMVLCEELDVSEEEAEEANHLVPNTYRSGYNQGWVDAIRMIVDATFVRSGAAEISRARDYT